MRTTRISCLTLAALLLAGSLSAQSLPPEVIAYADIVLYNGRVLTVNERFDVAEAVAIRDGKFIAVGPTARILAMAGPETLKKDLAGKTVVPGFIGSDADNDFAAGNLYKETLIKGKIYGTLDDLKTKDQIFAKVRETVAQAKPGEKLFFRLPEAEGDGFLLTAAELDKVAPDNPVAMSIDSTNMVINSRMMELLTERLPESHFAIVKDPKTGKPTGQIFGHATGIVGWDLRPWPTIDKAFLDEQVQLIHDLNKKGITTIIGHIQGFSLTILNILYHQNNLHVRVRGSHDAFRQNPFVEALARRIGTLVNFGLGDDVLIVGAGLASADGNADTASALTLQQKSNSGGYAFGAYGQNKWVNYGIGDATFEELPAELRDSTEWGSIQAAVRYGWNPIGIHNVGDKATDLWLDALETAQTQADIAVPRSLFSPRPYTLDHNLFWTEEQDARMKKLDMRRGLGKMFSGNTAASAEIYGPRIHDVQPVPALVERGLKVHIEGTDPWDEMESYITRKDRRGRIWGPDHAIDRKTALQMKTLWAARFINEDHRLGSIEVGKLADVAVLGQDFMTVPAEQISEVPVVLTIKGGKVVYDAEKEPAATR
jgi:predicted amidohydrolase YtcJ